MLLANAPSDWTDKFRYYYIDAELLLSNHETSNNLTSSYTVYSFLGEWMLLYVQERAASQIT